MELSDIISTLKRLASQPDTSCTAGECVNYWLKGAKRILMLVNAHPAIAIAILKLDNDLPIVTQHSLVLCLFGKLNRYNDHFLQHIVASLLVVYWTQSENVNQEQIKSVNRFLQRNGLATWLRIIKLRKALLSDKYFSLIPDIRISACQRLSFIAKAFAVNAKKEHAHKLFSQLAMRVPVNHHEILTPLVDLFTLPMPGAKIYVNNVPGVVVDVKQSHSFVFSLSKDDTVASWFANASIKAPVHLQIPFTHFIALYNDTAEDRVAKGGHSFLPSTYPIQQPPSALLRIIDELQNRDVDIDKLCVEIEKVPTFNSFLMFTASKDNRQQIKVNNIKQAVLTYGLERVGDMLIQFALMERLTQHQFPLLNRVKQFTLVSSALASSFASLTDTKLTPQSAALVMTFLCAPLFTLPGFKVSNALPLNQETTYRISQTFKVNTNTSWLTVSSELAQKWHQSASWRAIIHQCEKSTQDVPRSLQKEQVLMTLSFALATEVYLKGSNIDSASLEKFGKLYQRLRLAPSDLVQVLEGHRTLLFSPLLT